MSREAVSKVFQMTVNDAIKVHDNLLSVAGPCLNRSDFSARLIDDLGNEYDAHIPFVKPLVFDETGIILGITGSHDAESLKGRTLRSAN